MNDLAIWPYGTDRAYDALISGYPKLVQRFLLELLTPKGSDIYRPTRGTNFYRKWQSGLTTESQVLTAFVLAELQARTNLQIEETEDDVDNERYVKTELNKIEIDQNIVKLYITVISQQGDASVILPLVII